MLVALQYGRWGFRWEGSALFSYPTKEEALAALKLALWRGYP